MPTKKDPRNKVGAIVHADANRAAVAITVAAAPRVSLSPAPLVTAPANDDIKIVLPPPPPPPAKMKRKKKRKKATAAAAVQAAAQAEARRRRRRRRCRRHHRCCCSPRLVVAGTSRCSTCQ